MLFIVQKDTKIPFSADLSCTRYLAATLACEAKNRFDKTG